MGGNCVNFRYFNVLLPLASGAYYKKVINHQGLLNIGEQFGVNVDDHLGIKICILANMHDIKGPKMQKYKS